MKTYLARKYRKLKGFLESSRPKDAYRRLSDSSKELHGLGTKLLYILLRLSKCLGMLDVLCNRIFDPDFLLREMIAQGRMNDALELSTKALRTAPNDDLLLKTQACLVRRIHGWRESLPYWEALRDKELGGRLSGRRFKRNVFAPPPLLNHFEEITVNGRDTFQGSNRKVCVYTSLFGSYDNLQKVSRRADNIDFKCFTDQDITVQGWEIIKCKAKYDNPHVCAKEYKILPHKYLGDYDASLFLDASTYIFDDISPLINRYLIHDDFVMFRHPKNNCAFVEAEAILTGRKHVPLPVINQLEKYDIDGLPPGAGMLEASFIWRTHKDPGIMTFMESWWEEINTYSTRDQISLCYLMWKLDYRPKVLPEIFGTPRINPYFFRMPHNSHTKPCLTMPQTAELCFLYHEKHKNVASTQMRGKQLVDIINAQAGPLQARFTNDLHTKDTCVFLTKGLLKEITIDQISELKKNNYFVAADYVEDPPREDLHDFIDVYVASSILGYYKLAGKNTDKWVFLLTHHTDPRLKPKPLPMDRLRTGYFGELANTLHSEDLRDVIDFYGICTKTSSTDWLDTIGDYNLHYAVRNIRGSNETKPFLKGFTAARCGANILIDRYEGDAMYYLPPDYPFFVEDNSEASIRDILTHIQNTFGGHDWVYGLKALENVKRRCTNDYIYKELTSFFDLLRASAGTSNASDPQ